VISRAAAAWSASAALGLVAVAGGVGIVVSGGVPSGSPLPAITITDFADHTPPQPTGAVSQPDPSHPTSLPPGAAEPGPNDPAAPTAATTAPGSTASATAPATDPEQRRSGGGSGQGSGDGTGGTRVPAPQPSRAG
jgi:hypothetical protein